jgi:hypothetical protein
MTTKQFKKNQFSGASKSQHYSLLPFFIIFRVVAIALFIPMLICFVIIYLIDRRFYAVLHREFRKQDKELLSHYDLLLTNYKQNYKHQWARSKWELLTDIIDKFYK